MTFGLNNTLEMKRKSDKDTVTGFKKTRLIDLLSVNGTYDFNKDSMNLSDVIFNLRINPITWLNIVATSTLSPYVWDNNTGKTLGVYALTSKGKIGRLTQTALTSTITLTSKESRVKLSNTQDDITKNWTADYANFALHPEYLLDFDIPWKASFSHVYSINANQNKTASNSSNYTSVQTLTVNADVSFTQRWKLATNLNFDLEKSRLGNANFTLSRNMHCWALAFYWTPVGGNKSFLLSIRNTSTLFQDAKIEFRRPPAFL
jgi:hypothetical protein